MSLDARVGHATEAGTGPAAAAAPRAAAGLPWKRLAGAWQALGPVLCLHPARHWPMQPPPPAAPWPLQPALLGLLCASSARHAVEIDREGPCEWLAFLESTGRPSFALGLLPDSDLLAWEGLVAALQPGASADASWSFRCERWRNRWRDAGRWRGSCARLAEAGGAGPGRIGLRRVEVSAYGRRCALNLALRFGADLAQ